MSAVAPANSLSRAASRTFDLALGELRAAPGTVDPALGVALP